MVIGIGLDPVALSIAGVEIRWYGLFVAAAVFVAVLLARAAARRHDVSLRLVEDGALWVGLAALVGGRILYLLQNDLGGLAAHPLEVVAIWHGGLSFYGGLIAGLVALAIYARAHGLSVGLAADLAAPAAAAGQAIGHLGCLIGGDSYGLPTAGPLAVVYRNPHAMAPIGIPLQPTQLYEAIALGLVAVGLWFWGPRVARIGPGTIAALYLVANAVIRFGLFFLRDDVAVLGGLKVAQLIAIAVAAVGVAWFITASRTRRVAGLVPVAR